MSYRDEREALRQRVVELEQELAELRRERAEPPSLARGNLFLGAPTKLAWEHRLEGELDEESQAELVAMLRNAIGTTGRLESFGGVVTWTSVGVSSSRLVEFEIETRRGVTHLRLRESLSNVAGGMFGGIVGGLGGGGLGVIGPLLTIFAGGIPMALASVGWVGLVYLGTRLGFRHVVSERNRELRETFDRIVTLAEREVRGAPPAVRVEAEPAEPAEEVVEALSSDEDLADEDLAR